MKKIMVLVLAVAMLAMTTAAFAAVDEKSTDVKAKYVEGERVDVYSVDVVWGGMEFDYVAADEAWNSTTHMWEPTNEPVWVIAENSSNNIKVTNHSSVAVDITLTANMTAEGVTGTFSETSFNLAVATPAGAPSHSATFMPAGALASTVTDYAKIGEITVSID